MHTCQIGLLGKKRRCNGTVPQNVWVIGWYGYDMINRVWITTSKFVRATLKRSQQSTLGSGSCLHRRNSYWTWFSKKSSIKTPSVSLDHDFCFLSTYTSRCKWIFPLQVWWRTQDRGPKHCAGGSAPGQEMLRSKWMRMPLKNNQSTVQVGNGKCAKWSKNSPIGPRDGTQKLRIG